MNIFDDDGDARAGLEHGQAVLLSERRLRKQLAALADQCPDHLISTESYPGRGRPGRAPARPPAPGWCSLPTWTNSAPPCLAADLLNQGAKEFPGLVVVDVSGMGAPEPARPGADLPSPWGCPL